MLASATGERLSLSQEEREKFVEEELGPIPAEHGGVEVKFYGIEAFSAERSDIAVFESDSLEEYSSSIAADFV